MNALPYVFVRCYFPAEDSVIKPSESEEELKWEKNVTQKKMIIGSPT